MMKQDAMAEALKRKRMNGPTVEIHFGGSDHPKLDQAQKDKTSDAAPLPEHMMEAGGGYTDEQDAHELMKQVTGSTNEADGDMANDDQMNNADDELTADLRADEKQHLMGGEPKTLMGKVKKMALERMKK